MFTALKRSTETIIDNVIQIAYYMRGSVQYDSLMWKTPGERERMTKFIAERLKEQSKSLSPVF